MAEQRKEPAGKAWGGFPKGAKPAPPIFGVYRTYVDGANIRVIDGEYGERLRIPVRIRIENQGERRASIFANNDYSQNGKFMRVIKAINGISGDLDPETDLSTLLTSGDILTEVITDDRGYLQVVNEMPLPRYGEPWPEATYNAMAATEHVDAETGEITEHPQGWQFGDPVSDETTEAERNF